MKGCDLGIPVSGLSVQGSGFSVQGYSLIVRAGGLVSLALKVVRPLASTLSMGKEAYARNA